MRRYGKYGNKKTRLDGYVFDSRAEAARYSELKLLEKAGQIHSLTVHPVYELQPPFKAMGKTVRRIHYEGDFAYMEDGLVVEDVKGVATEVFRVKEKLFRYRYPHIDLRIIKVRRNR